MDQIHPISVYKLEKGMGDLEPKGVAHLDISSCLHDQEKPTEHLYFCPETYPPLQ